MENIREDQKEMYKAFKIFCDSRPNIKEMPLTSFIYYAGYKAGQESIPKDTWQGRG